MVYSSLCNSRILRITDGVLSVGGGRHSVRFCDVISLENLLTAWKRFSKGKRSAPDVARFELQLEENLFSLQLHPNKVTIRKLRQGTDFLGYVSLPHYLVLRTRTKNRMLKRLTALSRN